MQHELEGAVIGENQGAICPESTARLGGIEVVGNGVAGRVQRQSPLRAQQRRDVCEKRISLTIPAAAIGKLQGCTAQQGERGTIQACCSTRAREINAKRVLAIKSKVGINHCATRTDRKSSAVQDNITGNTTIPQHFQHGTNNKITFCAQRTGSNVNNLSIQLSLHGQGTISNADGAGGHMVFRSQRTGVHSKRSLRCVHITLHKKRGGSANGQRAGCIHGQGANGVGGTIQGHSTGHQAETAQRYVTGNIVALPLHCKRAATGVGGAVNVLLISNTTKDVDGTRAAGTEAGVLQYINRATNGGGVTSGVIVTEIDSAAGSYTAVRGTTHVDVIIKLNGTCSPGLQEKKTGTTHKDIIAGLIDGHGCTILTTCVHHFTNGDIFVCTGCLHHADTIAGVGCVTFHGKGNGRNDILVQVDIGITGVTGFQTTGTVQLRITILQESTTCVRKNDGQVGSITIGSKRLCRNRTGIGPVSTLPTPRDGTIILKIQTKMTSLTITRIAGMGQEASLIPGGAHRNLQSVLTTVAGQHTSLSIIGNL